MNELQILNSSEFGQIRTITKDNEPMFCLSDICKALEIKNATDVVKRLDFDEVTRLNLGGQSGETNFVTESGLYAVIIRSDKPNAKKFRKWVTSEVLPSIRKNGGYIANQENLTPEQIVANALVVAQNIILQKDRQIEEMQPKADFFDAVADSKSAIPMNEVAKVVTSLYGNEKFMNDVHNALREMYPEDYLDVYGDIKSILSKYATNQDKKADCDNKTLLHNEIQQILSKANAGKDVIAYVPGLVIKHCDEKNALQTIYRAIIQKFGQKKGLDIYNRIKKHIQENAMAQNVGLDSVK